MKRKTIILLLLTFGISMATYAQLRVDCFIGTVVDDNIVNFEESDDNYSFKTINVALNFRIAKNFELGLYVGYLYNSLIQRGAAEQDFYLLAYPVNYGIKAIFGNMGKFAVALNIGINPTIGLYVHNYFLNFGWGYSNSVTVYTIDLTNDTWTSDSKTQFHPYIEVGYSIPLSGKPSGRTVYRCPESSLKCERESPESLSRRQIAK